MTDASLPQASIVVEEYYTYQVDVGSQTNLACTQASGLIHVRVPYNGEHLRDVGSDQGQLPIGTLVVPTPDEELEQHLPLALDTTQLIDRLKRGEQQLWQARYTPPTPSDTLVSVEGEVFDGADIDLLEQPEQIYDTLFGQTDVFASDLRLQLSLWVPRLLSDSFHRVDNRELQAMFRYESATQILVDSSAHHAELAQSLVALANADGGSIILGVRRAPQGEVVGVGSDEELERDLLHAALLCSPPVPFSQPDYQIMQGGKRVARISVPASPSRPHAAEGRVYVRRPTGTAQEAAVAPAQPPRNAVRPLASLRDLIAGGNSRDVAIIDAESSSLDQLELGPYICGLLNNDVRDATLIVRHLTPGRRSALGSVFGGQRGLLQQLTARLRSELDRCTPTLSGLRPELATLDGEMLAVVHLPRSVAPAALYNERGYEWTGAALREVSVGEVFRRYLRQVGAHEHHRPSVAQVWMDSAQIAWPVRPPTVLKRIGSQSIEQRANVARYDVQRQSMVWQRAPFYDQEGTNGLRCTLSTSLRQAFVSLDGALESPASRPLSGQVCVQFDDVLVSGMGLRLDAQHPVLGYPPIVKRTVVVLNLTIHANELFRDRRRTTLLHFRLPDMTLLRERRERLADLRQACADLGFWVYDVYPADETQDSRPWVLLRGIRNTGHHDISLLAAVQHQPVQLTREQRINQRTDSRSVQTGVLDMRFVFWGSGANAAKEIATIQLELRQLLRERLHYLRAE
jgi:hypothetical protein